MRIGLNYVECFETLEIALALHKSARYTLELQLVYSDLLTKDQRTSYLIRLAKYDEIIEQVELELTNVKAKLKELMDVKEPSIEAQFMYYYYVKKMSLKDICAITHYSMDGIKKVSRRVRNKFITVSTTNTREIENK